MDLLVLEEADQEVVARGEAARLGCSTPKEDDAPVSIRSPASRVPAIAWFSREGSSFTSG